MKELIPACTKCNTTKFVVRDRAAEKLGTVAGGRSRQCICGAQFRCCGRRGCRLFHSYFGYGSRNGYRGPHRHAARIPGLKRCGEHHRRAD